MSKGDLQKIDGYATHQQALIKYALKAKEGDTIIELGAGNYSSPILYEICKSNNLNYKIYSSDILWMEEVQKIIPKANFVDFNFVEDWSKWELKENAHLTLLDNEELVINRYKHIKRSLRKHSKYIVVHDADTYPKRGIELTKDYSGELFNKLVPNTFVIDCAKYYTEIKVKLMPQQYW